jgi:8-oxo-dGTP diphosphatase
MRKHVNSTIVFIYNENKNKVLMVERVKRFDFDWGFLCGKFEEGEDKFDCVKREIKEELGLENLDLKELKKVKHEKDGETYYHYYFYTTIPENTPLKLQKKEIKQAKWFYLNELPESRAPDDPKEALKVINGG